MLWLAVHLPLLSLEACAATLAAPAPATAAEPRPLALVADHRITHADARAQACGIHPGLKRATALALAADLLLAEADPARDAAALQAVAHAALAFTPAVALHDEATVVLEVQSSLRLFGGLAALVARLRAALVPLNPPAGHRVQLAAAPTATGAALLARWSPPQAGDLVFGAHARTVAALARLFDRAPPELLAAARGQEPVLQDMGLATLGELRRLPRDGLARRFGADLVAELDRALGRAPDPRRWLELPERFDSRLELHQRADSAEQVLAAAAVLLARLVAFAQARHARIGAFTLAMQHEPRHRGGAAPATELRIEFAAPALDAAHLQLLLRERLAQCRLAAPTLELRLRCSHLVAGAPPSGELFPSRGSEALGLARLLERLRARLGDAQVQHLVPVADHRPERASRCVPARDAAEPGPTAPRPSDRNGRNGSNGKDGRALPPQSSRNDEDHALPLSRPVWLLPEPLPLAEQGELPLLDGQPLQLVSGPERIEAGWWDGATAARDYFIALAGDGSLVWVWRSRLPVAGEAGGRGEVQWMMQGRFA